MTPSTSRFTSTGLVLVSLFGAAHLLARIAGALLGSPSLPALDDVSPPPIDPAYAPEIRLSALLDRNLFGAARDPRGDPRPPRDDLRSRGAECAPSTMSPELIATLVSPDGAQSLAVLADRGRDMIGSYRSGERLADDSEILRIEAGRVFVGRAGRCEILTLEAAPAPSPAVAPQPSGLLSGARSIGRDAYEIPRAELDELLSNLARAASGARIVPSFDRGAANGFRILSVQPGSAFARLGIENGDVVQRIDGLELTGPDRWLEIHERLKGDRPISVDLLRKGAPRSLAYSIR